MKEKPRVTDRRRAEGCQAVVVIASRAPAVVIATASASLPPMGPNYTGTHAVSLYVSNQMPP